MHIKDLIREGKLTEARTALVNEVKNRPGDSGSRTLLFQVLLFFGEWDKANRHLEVLAELDPKMALTLAQYQNLLKCEHEREAVTSFRNLPTFLPEPPAYFEDYYQACQQLLSSRDGSGKERFNAVEAAIPQVAGTVNGTPFSGMRNGDDMLAFALEVFAHDRYVWVPFEAIRELTIVPPQSLLDLMWIAASITTWGGLSINGFLPVLYPDTWKHENEQVRIGRMTDWVTGSGDGVRGAGQQLFVFGDQAISLLEIREVRCKITTQEHNQSTDGKGTE